MAEEQPNMKVETVNWDAIQKTERSPPLKLTTLKVGESTKFVMQGEPQLVTADRLKEAYNKSANKAARRIVPEDHWVFGVDHEGEKKSLWIKAKSRGYMNQIKEIRVANKNSLTGAKVLCTRISEGDSTTQSFEYKAA